MSIWTFLGNRLQNRLLVSCFAVRCVCLLVCLCTRTHKAHMYACALEIRGHPPASPLRLGWLAAEPQGPVCLHLPLLCRLFDMGSGDQTQALGLTQPPPLSCLWCPQAVLDQHRCPALHSTASSDLCYPHTCKAPPPSRRPLSSCPGHISRCPHHPGPLISLEISCAASQVTAQPA